MDIGTKIKEQRSKNGLTQKDLAERLHVTYQAVSRWENNDAEPSFDCLKKMTDIFHCTMDDLFGIEKENREETDTPEEVAVATPTPALRVLSLCDDCKKAIYEEEDLHRLEKKVREGRTSRKVTEVVCSSCLEKREEQARRDAERRAQEEKENLLKRRKRSFIWPSLIAVVILAIGVALFVKEKTTFGIIAVVVAVLAYLFFACVFLDNTFIPDLWLEVASWGFVRMPGVIMEFSLGGLIFGFILKIFLWALGIAIAVAAVLGATALAMVLSPFVYPFALRRNMKGISTD